MKNRNYQARHIHKKPVAAHRKLITGCIGVAAAAVLIVTALNFAPRLLKGNTVADITKTTAIVKAKSNTDYKVQETKESVVTAPAAQNTSWSDKFAGKFTGGEVKKTENSYVSANINLQISKITEENTVLYVADFYLKDIRFFKTAFASGRFGRGFHESTAAIAKSNNAVLAINGDYSGLNAGPVVRNGVLYRDEKYRDVLVMAYDGTMKAYAANEFNMDKIKQEGAWQVWTFGPMLLKKGQPMETFNSTLNPANPRTAIGYYEPGHYCFVVADGRQPGYSEGFTLKQMSSLFYKLGCKEAFNLDGGQSSEMAFMGSYVNIPYNGGRGTSDIVYIANE